MNLQPGHHAPAARGHRCLELVLVGDVAADQHIATTDLADQCTGDRRVGQQIDRQHREHRPVARLRQPVTQAALIAHAVPAMHRAGNQRRRAARRLWPASGDAVGIDHQIDAGRADARTVQPRHETVEKALLVIAAARRGAEPGISEPSRRAHPRQRAQQHGILVLRLVDQDIDADRPRAHAVERRECARQHRPVEGRTLARVDHRLVVIDDQHDAIVLRHARRKAARAHVVKRALGAADEGQGPVPPRDQQCEQQHRGCGDQPPATGIPHDPQRLVNWSHPAAPLVPTLTTPYQRTRFCARRNARPRVVSCPDAPRSRRHGPGRRRDGPRSRIPPRTVPRKSRPR